jgi:hypothetical protein
VRLLRWLGLDAASRAQRRKVKRANAAWNARRECGWLGCGDPRCEPTCKGVKR